MQVIAKNILLIHQSTDLYGSDKTLLYLVKKLDKKSFNPIVVLPDSGPLYGELNKLQVRTIILPVIKIHRGMFKIRTLINLLVLTFKSMNTLKQELKDIKIDIIHSNTVVILLGAMYAKRHGIRHFWHIHEIIKTPKVVAKLFSNLVYYCSDKVIFNSKATQTNFLQHKSKLKKKSTIIYNGITREEKASSNEEILTLRQSLKIKDNDIVFGLFGRINENKGHELLVSAFKRLYENYKNTHLLIIGSTIDGKEELLTNLRNRLNQYKMDEYVTIMPFQKNIWRFWDIIDVAVVPSTIPESFGLVALEAMLSKKAVIGSDEGGLTEIVVHNETGILFETKNVEALENAMRSFIHNEELITSYGNEAYKRAKEKFTLKEYIDNFERVYTN